MRLGVVLAVALALAAFPNVSLADDYGPHRALREIRGALPILLATAMSWLPRDATSPHADDIVVDGNDAVATWRAGTHRGLVVMHRRSDLWWITGSAYQMEGDDLSWQMFAPGTRLPCLDPVHAALISVGVLQTRLGVGSQLAEVAREHIASVAIATDFEVRHDPSAGDRRIYEDCYYPPASAYEINTDSNYVATLSERLPENVAMRARAPTEGEMPPSRGANSYYFFSITNGGNTSVTFPAGLKLDVWCPFVLDLSLRYSLTIAGSDPIVGPVDGTLRDNVLHFDLPAFAAKPGAELMGEVEGDPRI